MKRKVSKILAALDVAEAVILSACGVPDAQETTDSSTQIETTSPSGAETTTETGAVTTFPTGSETMEPSETTKPQTTASSTTVPTAQTTSATLPTTETTSPPTSETTAVPTTVPATETTAAPTTAPTTSTAPTTAPEYDTTYFEWYNIRNKTHTTPGIPDNAGPWLAAYNGIFTGDTSRKIFYFTFDCGADTGYAGEIMDTLRDYGIKATFFVTKPYITNNPDIVRRMTDEGHVVANHTVSHTKLPNLTDEEIRREYRGVEDEFTRVTGQDMINCIRPPMGGYSERSLYVTSLLGYKTVFWSIAYKDYDLSDQPTHDEAMAIVENNHHNGAIMLLHVASPTNAEALDDMIEYLQDQGYSFGVIA